MQAIYLLSDPNGTMKLYQFVIIFGGLMLILAQMPSFHSLRHINLISLVLCLAYSACAAAGSIYIGNTTRSTYQHMFRFKKRWQNWTTGWFECRAYIQGTQERLLNRGELRRSHLWCL